MSSISTRMGLEILAETDEWSIGTLAHNYELIDAQAMLMKDTSRALELPPDVTALNGTLVTSSTPDVMGFSVYVAADVLNQTIRGTLEVARYTDFLASDTWAWGDYTDRTNAMYVALAWARSRRVPLYLNMRTIDVAPGSVPFDYTGVDVIGLAGKTLVVDHSAAGSTVFQASTLMTSNGVPVGVPSPPAAPTPPGSRPPAPYAGQYRTVACSLQNLVLTNRVDHPYWEGTVPLGQSIPQGGRLASFVRIYTTDNFAKIINCEISGYCSAGAIRTDNPGQDGDFSPGVVELDRVVIRCHTIGTYYEEAAATSYGVYVNGGETITIRHCTFIDWKVDVQVGIGAKVLLESCSHVDRAGLISANGGSNTRGVGMSAGTLSVLNGRFIRKGIPIDVFNPIGGVTSVKVVDTDFVDVLATSNIGPSTVMYPSITVWDASGVIELDNCSMTQSDAGQKPGIWVSGASTHVLGLSTRNVRASVPPAELVGFNDPGVVRQSHILYARTVAGVPVEIYPPIVLP